MIYLSALLGFVRYKICQNSDAEKYSSHRVSTFSSVLFSRNKSLDTDVFYALRAFGISSRISTLEHKYKVQHKMRCFPNFVLRF